MKADRERMEPFLGKRVIIDAGFSNGGIVILTQIYGDHFCQVKDPETGSQWQTMLYRLSVYNPAGITNSTPLPKA